MERGNHPLVNLRPGAIETLVQLGVPPIVLLITASEPNQILGAFKGFPEVNDNLDASIQEAERLWTEMMQLKKSIGTSLTDTVPLQTGSGSTFDEDDWIRNLFRIIQHHQRQPVSWCLCLFTDLFRCGWPKTLQF